MRAAVRWVAAGIVALAPLALPAEARAATWTIEVRDFAFQPTSLTIRPGDVVTWTNRDTAAHTATATGAWDTGVFAPGTSRSITFGETGTYTYFCLIHSIMFATLTVTAGDIALSQQPSPKERAAVSVNSAPAGRIVVAAADPDAGGIPVRTRREVGETGSSPLTYLSWAVFTSGLLVLAWHLSRTRLRSRPR